MRPRFVAVLLVVAALVVLLVAEQGRARPERVSGTVEGDEIRLGARVGGRVAKVHVEEGRRVARGEALFELEAFDLHEQRAAAVARAQQRRAELELLAQGYRSEEIAQAGARRDRLAARLEELERGPRPQEIAAARARLDEADARVELAVQRHARISKLAVEGIQSQEDLDRAVQELRAANGARLVRSEELALLEAGTRAEAIAEARASLAEAAHALALLENGPRPAEIDAARASVAAAEAEVGRVERAIGELVVTAPRDAIVEAFELDPGDLVGADAPIVSLLDPTALWVRAWVPADRLDVAAGREVVVTADAFPGRTFRGRVSVVSRDAEFTPNNVQLPEERIKRVFRIRVRIEDGVELLRPGMTVDVDLDAGTVR